MRFAVLSVLSFAYLAVAAPNVALPRTAGPPADMTVWEGSQRCGNDADLACCNLETTSGDQTNIAAGLLSGIFQGAFNPEGTSLGQCAYIPVNILSVNDLLGSKCKHTVACCASSGNVHQTGLININSPVQCNSLTGVF